MNAMKGLTLACAVVIATTSEARSQSNYTYDATRQVLVDNTTGLKWQCGFGLSWTYFNYFPVTYDRGKDVCPGIYAQGPYGAPGGWRMPTTAELIDASRKGMLKEQFQLAVMLGIAGPQDDWSWWTFWGV